MDKQYKNLIAQQNISAETTARFYEKLEETKSLRKPVRLKAVLVAVCIALMIPLTVLAVENIFGAPKVKLGELDWYDGPNGYSIRFENLDSFPLDAMPKQMQTITEHKRVPYDSWEAAEKDLGIDLLNNTFLQNASKITMRYDDLGRTHCKITYSSYENQLFYVSPSAHYKYDGIQLDLKAKLVVEHPELDEESKQVLLGLEGAVTKPETVDLSYEKYTTKAGIPVVILRCDTGFAQHIEYTAMFAVNNISYQVTAWVNRDREENDRQILLDVLEGFQLK